MNRVIGYDHCNVMLVRPAPTKPNSLACKAGLHKLVAFSVKEGRRSTDLCDASFPVEEQTPMYCVKCHHTTLPESADIIVDMSFKAEFVDLIVDKVIEKLRGTQ